MVSFKKLIGVGVVSAAALVLAGFSLAEVGEYFQVVRNRVSSGIHGGIPLSVEIDRMEVLLKKLDAQENDQTYAVARFRVALQDAEAEFERSQGSCENLLSEMRQLRDLSKSEASGSCEITMVGYRKVSAEDIHRALAYKLSMWKSASATAKAREQALEQQRTAFAKLEQQFADWQSQRSLLAQRLETLKARLQTQQLASETDTTVFNDADLARTTELADQIERQIRIAEAQQALGNDPVASIMSNIGVEPIGADVEAEVDGLLRSTDSTF